MLYQSIPELIAEAANFVPAIKEAGVEATFERLSQIQDQVLVVKYGGNAMTDETLQQQFAQDVALLTAMGVPVVVVHGGGPQIDSMLKRVGIEGQFIQGMRVTDADTMSIVDGVLCGNVQGQIVNLINQAGKSYGVRAVGMSGKDGRMVRVKRMRLADVQNPDIEHDIGLVGEVIGVDTALIENLLDGDFLPVVSPIAADDQGVTHNVNADVAAGEIACAMHANKLMLLTNIKGVLDKQGELIANIDSASAAALKADGTLYGGMLPKIDSALDAAQRGVGAVHIVDGRVPHVLLQCLLTDADVGTAIRV